MSEVKIADVDKKMGAYVDDSTNMAFYNTLLNDNFIISDVKYVIP